MAETAADVVVQTLINWGVQVIFGIPGDGISGVIEALRKRCNDITFVQARQAEAPALMACGYARFTGRLGVCLATSGPGGIQLLNGLYDAKLDGQPVLAITGMPFHDLLATHGQQDVELDRLFMDACVYNTRIMGPAHAQSVTELACRSALVMRGAAHITIPIDVQTAPLGRAMRPTHTLPQQVVEYPAAPVSLPGEDHLVRAADVLNAGRKVCVLVGRGALAAGAEVAQVAERLAAPVVEALLGKGVLPDASPYLMGGIGVLGSRPSQDAMEACDTLLIVGSSFPYIEYYPPPGQARVVQIDADPRRIGLRTPVQVGLVGDAAAILRALLPRLGVNADRSFLDSARRELSEWRDELSQQATRGDTPMKPQLVAAELDRLLADNALIAADSGTNTAWAARFIRMRGSMRFAASGTLATMACALPYAIAGAIAYPGRPCVCCIGDGGLAMLLGELATCVKYRLDVKIVVIKNDSLGEVKWKQVVVLGNPEYACDLQPIDFAAVARGFGLAAFTIERPEECAEVLSRAMSTPGPVLIEAVVDPNEPPLPPKATPTQAAHMTETLTRGTPNRRRIALTLASAIVRQVV
jgi:pyruvate dehydrogenase (quinone)/pyruvate oxidase